MSVSGKFDRRSEDKASSNSQVHWLGLLDRDSLSVSPGLGDRTIINSPKSEKSFSYGSDELVQSGEDEHYSPNSLTPTKKKPGLFAVDVSKSDTESKGPNQGINFVSFFL